MVIVRPCLLVGAPFCGAPVRPNMLNMPKSVSGYVVIATPPVTVADDRRSDDVTEV